MGGAACAKLLRLACTVESNMSILVTKSLSRSVLQGGRQVLVLLQSRKQNTYQPALVWGVFAFIDARQVGRGITHMFV